MIKKKSAFLENQILPILEKKNLKIGEIIRKGYVKQIRDAIAHNEYWHNWARPEIILENYKPNPKRIDALHYNEWTKYFCYTFLLAHHSRNYVENMKDELDDEKCKNGFDVKIIGLGGKKLYGKIFYTKEHDQFNFKAGNMNWGLN